MDTPAEEGTSRRLAELRVELGARAAGYWWVVGDWLEQVAFAASPTLDTEVAQAFAEATRSVSLSRPELGIVQAALSGAPAVSRAAELPEDAGSGYWLRAFGAERSVAVPLHDPSGALRAVVSVALPAGGHFDDDETVVERIRLAGQGWGPPALPQMPASNPGELPRPPLEIEGRAPYRESKS